MKYSHVYSAQSGINTVTKITLEADISRGLHNFSIIGLTDKAIDEARDRVGAAIKNSSLTSPKTQNQKITISLAPADLRKEGPLFDLPIALVYLLASEQINFDCESKCFVGELSLSGELRPVHGVLSIARSAKALGFKELYVPKANELEAALVEDVDVYGIENLNDLVKHLTKVSLLKKAEMTKLSKEERTEIDISEVKSQTAAKRALLIAAAGGHNIALYGPPGTGKTMLAKVFRGILPELSKEEVFEVASIHSNAGILTKNINTTPPFRSPHHTSSHVAVVGGGTNPKPGEITLAHRGVLFMDEFPEFDKRVLESLREPLEDGQISVSRAKGRAIFPADFILVAALNPCPCGNYGNQHKRCTCTQSDIERYTKKISGPIMDRIDMWVEVSHVDFADLHQKNTDSRESLEYKNKVQGAREHAYNRSALLKNKKLNSKLSTKEIEQIIHLDESVKKTLQTAAKSLALSPRVYFKTIKLARTIADIEGDRYVNESHILEALQYRPKI